MYTNPMCPITMVMKIPNKACCLASALMYEVKAPFTRDRIQMGSDPFGSDPLFEVRLHGIGSRIVGVYTRSDPFGFYELLAAF